MKHFTLLLVTLALLLVSTNERRMKSHDKKDTDEFFKGRKGDDEVWYHPKMVKLFKQFSDDGRMGEEDFFKFCSRAFLDTSTMYDEYIQEGRKKEAETYIQEAWTGYHRDGNPNGMSMYEFKEMLKELWKIHTDFDMKKLFRKFRV